MSAWWNMIDMLFMAILGSAVADPRPLSMDSSCSSACACRAHESGLAAWRAIRAARRTTTSIDLGGLDTNLLDEASTEFQRVSDGVRTLLADCAPLPSTCSVNATSRRICGCRLPRIANLTLFVTRRLDDAAAGVLFGDSEQNVLNLAAALPTVLRLSQRAAGELERYGRRCEQTHHTKPVPARHRIARTSAARVDPDAPQLADR